MASSKRSPLFKLLSESVLIIFSILLALVINEWRSTYNENRRTKKLLENIREELQANQQLMSQLIPYHESVLLNTIAAFEADSLEETFFQQVNFEILQVAPRGVIQGKIYEIAWEVAVQAEISNRIDFPLAKALSQVYSQQQTVQHTLTRIIDLLGEREIHRKELVQESVVLFLTEMNELYGQEQYLADLYAEVIAKLE